VQGGSLKLLAIAEPQDSKRGFAQLGSLLEHSCEYRLHVAGRGIDDLQHLCGRSLPLKRLFQLVGESDYLLLQVINGRGCGRYFASLGPIRASTFDRLLAFTALPHFAPRGGHDDAQAYPNPGFHAMAGFFGSFSTGAAGFACRSMSAFPSESGLIAALQRNAAKGQNRTRSVLAQHGGTRF
jgi:hypothetical protein